METVFPVLCFCMRLCALQNLCLGVSETENKPDYLLAGGPALHPGAIHLRDGDFPSKCQRRVQNIHSRKETGG